MSIKSLSVLLLLSFPAMMSAGKNTANAMYYMTKGACYTGAAAAVVVTFPASSVIGTAVAVPATVVVGASSLAPVVLGGSALALGTAAKGKIVAAAAVGVSESLAQKAYNLGMKL